MTISDLTRDLLAAGYTIHQALNDDGTARCWADHTHGNDSSHVIVGGFGPANGLVMADYADQHQVVGTDTDPDLLAAAQWAATLVDSGGAA